MYLYNAPCDPHYRMAVIQHKPLIVNRLLETVPTLQHVLSPDLPLSATHTHTHTVSTQTQILLLKPTQCFPVLHSNFPYVLPGCYLGIIPSLGLCRSRDFILLIQNKWIQGHHTCSNFNHTISYNCTYIYCHMDFQLCIFQISHTQVPVYRLRFIHLAALAT
jgi:hypothetical protein